MRIYATLLLSLLMVLPVAAQQDLSSLFHNVTTQSVIALSIHYKDPDAAGSASGQCTSVKVGVDEWVTAAHCFQHPFRAIVGVDNNRHTGMTYVRSNVLVDLALLYSAGFEDKTPLPLAKHSPLPGVPVMGIGYPSNPYVPELVVGYISRVTENQITADHVLLPGYSGGPMVDLQGELIGINVEAFPAFNEGFVVPIEKVRKFLENKR